MIYPPDRMWITERIHEGGENGAGYTPHDCGTCTLTYVQGIEWEYACDHYTLHWYGHNRVSEFSRSGIERYLTPDPTAEFFDLPDKHDSTLDRVPRYHRTLVNEKIVMCFYNQGCEVLSNGEYNINRSPEEGADPNPFSPEPHLDTMHWTWDPRTDGLLPPDYHGERNGR